MTRLALRGIAARKLRSVLTAMAIVMGVAMVTGAFVVSDTLVNGSDKLREAAYSNTDAVVAKKTLFSSDTVGGSDRTAVPAQTLAKVRALPQVQGAVGDLLREAKVIGKDGKVVGTGPYFADGFDAKHVGSLSPFHLKSGRWATGPGEVVLDQGTADKEDIKTGGTVRLAANGPVKTYKVVGTTQFGEVDSLGSATIALFDLRTAQDIYGAQGQYDSILVDAKPGVSKSELNSALQGAAPGFDVMSAEKQDRFTLDGLDEFLSFIKVFLIAFGAIAVFMGAFIIFNTLNITVAQRSRELGMLRSLGASRRQVLRSVVLEAFAIGLAASLLGMAVGFALGAGLMALLAAAGIELPETGLVFAAHTATTALIVGTGVTVLAGLVPAIRATRVAPIEALRDGTLHRKPSRKAPWIAGGVSAVATGLVAYGLFGSGLEGADRLKLMGFGALLLFIGVAMLASRMVVPLASVLGRPAQRFGGSAGKLARGNSMREPGRTAATAASLMIGIALVTFVAVLAGGIKESVRGTIQDQVQAEQVLASSDLYTPIPDKAYDAASRVKGVGTITGIRTAEGRSFGDTATYVGSVNPSRISSVYRYTWAEGSDEVFARLGTDGAIVRESYAKDHALKVGSHFTLTSRTGDKLNVVVRGIESTPTVNPLNLGDVVLSDAGFDRAFDATGYTFTWIKAEPGQSAAVKAGLDKALANYADVKVFSKAQFIDEEIKFVDMLLGIIYVLLALSAIVSLFGIINTLALSVFERTREVGMLRAVGMTRRQVRRMIRHESIITALIGATLGAGLGIVLGFLTVKALEEDGLKFVVPFGSIVVVGVVAVVAGMIAAIGPARRAAKIEPVAALQYE